MVQQVEKQLQGIPREHLELFCCYCFIIYLCFHQQRQLYTCDFRWLKQNELREPNSLLLLLLLQLLAIMSSCHVCSCENNALDIVKNDGEKHGKPRNRREK